MDTNAAFDPSCAPGPRWITVSNLPREANEAWLKMLFAPFGLIDSIEFTNEDGSFQAHLLFHTSEQAISSLQFDGFSALGLPLQVRLRSTHTQHQFVPSSTSLPANLDPFSLARHSLSTSASGMISRPHSQFGQHGGSLAPGPPLGGDPTPTHKNLYVLNLPLDATTDQLTALFATYGTVVHCVILAMLDAQARRRGFIDMSSPKEAKEAIEGLNGFVWHGYPIEVSYAIVQRSGGPFDQNNGRNIIKRNVPRNRFNTGPRRIPSEPMADANIMAGLTQHFNRQLSLGSTHANSASETDLYGLATAHARHDVDGSGTSQSGTVVDPYTVFVAGLDPVAIADDDDFRTALEPYGAITAATLCRDELGTSRGFGIVTFATQQSATNLCDSIDGRTINGHRLTAHKYVYHPSGRPIASTSLLPSDGFYGPTMASRTAVTRTSTPAAYNSRPSFGLDGEVDTSSMLSFRPRATESFPTTPLPLASNPLGQTLYNDYRGMLGSQTGMPTTDPWKTGQSAYDGALPFFKPTFGNRAVEIKPDPAMAEGGAKKKGTDEHSTSTGRGLGDPFDLAPKKPITNEKVSDRSGEVSCSKSAVKVALGSAASIHSPFHSRTPPALGSPWSTATTTSVSPGSQVMEHMTPQSTVSLNSSVSRLSQKQTPEKSRIEDASRIWAHSTDQGQGDQWKDDRTAMTADKQTKMTGSALLSLQSDIVDKASRSTSSNLAPVGHEKTTSPLRTMRPSSETKPNA